MITCEFEDGGKAQLRHVTVTTFVVNKERTKYLLVQRSGEFSEPHKWAPPGGFVSRDETVAEAALREAQEESGWKAKVISLIRINDIPNRPKEDRQNVDFLYLCEAVEKLGNHDHEITNIKWVDLAFLPEVSETAFDHYDSIRLCLAFLKKPFVTPLDYTIPSELFDQVY